MPALPRRETEQMHLGRVSRPGAAYFVTFVTKDRASWLLAPAARDSLLAALRAWHAEGDGTVLAATAMPDHAHVLFELGRRLDVGRCVARRKARTRAGAGYAGAWQRDFWEHDVRTAALCEEYALYLFLNPYRATLLRRDRTWAGWWTPEPSRFRFMSMLGPGGEPQPEWIDWPESRFENLRTGE
jgi:putative transposase